jgi:hypothetical protein
MDLISDWKEDSQTILKQVETFYLEHNHLPENVADLLECGFDEVLIYDLFENVVSEKLKIKVIALYLYKKFKNAPNLVSKSVGRAIRIQAKEYETC